MIIKGKTYKLDDIYLRCTRVSENDVGLFQICDKDGVIKPPKRAKNGFITDHGTRLVFRRINELIEVKQQIMFSYYGSKSKIVNYYPPPKHQEIIEPFAGSARYSLKYWQNDVLLVDKYQVVIDVWNYLKCASEKDILDFKKLNLKPKDKLTDFNLSEIERKFIGFLIVSGVSQPGKNVASFEGIDINRNGFSRIANNLHKIRHWNIICDDYVNLDNIEATWFIDPPYQFGGEHYKESSKNIDFKQLAEWCKSRNGQVIVCENTKADWLPFKPMIDMVGSVHKTTEAIWSNHKTNYDNTQLQISYES